MKKFLLLVCALVTVSAATAQEKSIWGVRAGLNISDMTAKEGNVSLDMESRVGYLWVSPTRHRW